jgi:hypothetical protein
MTISFGQKHESRCRCPKGSEILGGDVYSRRLGDEGVDLSRGDGRSAPLPSGALNKRRPRNAPSLRTTRARAGSSTSR